MPRWITLNKSGVHRAACFALYRALLRRAHQLPAPEGPRSHLKKRIRKTFRKNAKLQGPSAIVTALRSGYATLQTLQTRPPGWQDALTSTLRPTTKHSIAPIPQSTPTPPIPSTKPISRPRKKPRPPTPRVWPYPNATPILSRPPSSFTALRHIPKLINTNGVPFLRLRKPQSPFLGRMIRDTVRARLRHMESLHALEDTLSYAGDEDRWDGILARTCGVAVDEDGGDWGMVTRRRWEELMQLGRVQVRRRVERARKMWEIVVEGRKTVEVERRGRRERSRERYRARRRERRAGVEGGGGIDRGLVRYGSGPRMIQK